MQRVLVTCLFSQQSTLRNEYTIYVGTYTNNGNSKGIYAFRFDPAKGQFTTLGLVAETINPSFLAIHPNHRFLYAVNEINNYEGQNAGSISAFSVDASSGSLSLLNKASSRGEGPCHLTVDKTGKCVLAANYGSGSVAAFPVKTDGRIGEASSFMQQAARP